MGTINYWAVLVAAVVSLAIGMVWFMDPVFGKGWKKMQGISGAHKPPLMAMAIWAGSGYVMAYALARLLVVKMGVSTLEDALVNGLLIAVGIAIAGGAPGYAFANKPWKLAAIEMGGAVVAILVMSVIVVVWR